MKKILVLVMVLAVLSGCTRTMDDGTTTIKATTEFLYNKLLTLEEQNETSLDRLDTIETQIHDLDDFGVEEIQQDLDYLLTVLEYGNEMPIFPIFHSIGKATINLNTVTSTGIYDTDPNNYMIKVVCYENQTNIYNYNSDDLDMMIRNYNELKTALLELEEVEDDTYDKEEVIDYVDMLIEAMLSPDGYDFTYNDSILCLYDDGELDWCLPIEQLLEEDLG
jgi:chaperonin cofactor prefoldin